MIHAFETGDGWARYVDMNQRALRIERDAAYPDNVIVWTSEASIPVSTLRDMVRRFERPERNLLAEQLDEQRARAEAAEVKVEAAREKAATWRRMAGAGGLGATEAVAAAASQLRRCGEELAAVLDPPPGPLFGFEVRCVRCGNIAASDPEALAEYLREHECPGGAS